VQDLLLATLLRDDDGATTPVVTMIDESAEPAKRVLFSNTSSRAPADEIFPIDHWIRFGNRRWHILYDPMPGVAESSGWARFWLWLILGSTISFTVAGYMTILLGRNATVRRLVHERTLQLANAKSELETRNQEIESFYQTVSHELKTPLTCIHESLAILLEGFAGELADEQREFLETASESGYQMNRSIDDLLNATRMDSGKLSVELAPVAIAKVIESVVRSMKLGARDRSITITTDLARDLPDVHIDDTRIAQVLRNLLSNALKFTPAGGEVTIRTADDDKDPHMIRVSVSDTGRGIPHEHVDRVFERHHQVRDEDHSSGGGLGLGLHICKELVRLHGGEIRVESKVGLGSMFSFTLSKAEVSVNRGSAFVSPPAR
jgi:signal transduction histidine kinase